MEPVVLERLVDIAFGIVIGSVLAKQCWPGRVRAGNTVPARRADPGREKAPDASRRRNRGVMYLAPSPPPGSETPAHRVLRLGDGPESPIHSQSPDDWEEWCMPSGEVWRAPRGLQEIGDRAEAAFHLRKTFRRVT